jgi:hypothetical protein
MATTRPNVGINVAGTGPTPDSIEALVDAIERVMAAGYDREERLAAIELLGRASTGGVSISGCDFTIPGESS